MKKLKKIGENYKFINFVTTYLDCCLRYVQMYIMYVEFQAFICVSIVMEVRTVQTLRNIFCFAKVNEWRSQGGLDLPCDFIT